MRCVSSATWTSGEPVSPSEVPYSAMIFFLVSASVPVATRSSSRFMSLRGAPGPVHPGTLDPRPSYGVDSCPGSRPGNRPRLATRGTFLRIATAGRSSTTTARPWQSARMEQRLGVCNLCEAICGLVFTLEQGPDGERITDVRGNPDDPLSRGHICPKAVALQDVHEDPDRLRRPVRRIGDRWQEVSWDEALDLVATNLARAVNEDGRDALAIYLGNPNVHSLGSMTHGTAMVKSFRTRNKYSATSVDQLPAQLLAYLMYGHQLLLPVPDIDRTGHFLVF